MITQDHINNAQFEKELVEHVLSSNGLAKAGKTTVNGEEVIIYLDGVTNELIHHEVVNPQEITTDWNLFFDTEIKLDKN